MAELTVDGARASEAPLAGGLNPMSALIFVGLLAAGLLFTAYYGLPASTTHVLSSDVAGTIAANRSGLQMPPVCTL